MKDDVYRVILDHALAGIWDWDMQTDETYFSPSFKAMFGYNDDELENSQETWRNLILPEDLPVALAAVDKHIADKDNRPFEIELRFRHKNGQVVWLKCSGAVTEWGPDKKPARMTGCNIDITRQKKSEQKLKRTKELLNKTNLSVRLGGWEYDVLNDKLAWTRVTKQIYGVPLDYEPQIDTGWAFYKDGEQRDRLRVAIKNAIKNGDSFEFEAIIINTAGREIWVRVTGNAEFDNGRCIKLFGTTQDIDEEVRVRDELQRSEDRFKSAFENSPIGIALVSPQGKWLKVNKQLHGLLGYTHDELNSKTFQDITHPDDLQKDLDNVNQLLNGEIQHYQMEKRYFSKSGNIIWALLSVSLVRDSDGNPLHFISQIQDITDKKAHEERIEETLNVVNKQNDRLLNFAYIVSHNLRTHSGNFQSLINLVNDPHTDAEERIHYLQLLQNVSTQLNDTILNLNDVVSIQVNTQLQKTKVNLNEFITKTINVLTGEITAHNVLINNLVCEDVQIEYHPAYLESILLNFLTNGIRYRSESRRPEITIKYISENNRGVLCITDNGRGIDMDKHGQNLFGMYKTFHGNTDAKGVGLFITKNQVEAMGGKIEVNSKIDTGTTFKVYLS